MAGTLRRRYPGEGVSLWNSYIGMLPGVKVYVQYYLNTDLHNFFVEL